MDITKLTGDRTALVNKIIDALTKTVDVNQNLLLRSVIDDFLDKLDTQGGIIQNTLKNKRLLSLFDSVFTKYNDTASLEVIKAIIDGVQQIVNFNADYFTALAPKSQLTPITNQAATLIDTWLGITPDGKTEPNGYLDTLINDSTVKNQIRNIVIKSIINQEGYNTTKQNLKEYITGTDQNTGAMQKYYRNFVYDTYSTLDRANAQVYADGLDLNYAIYEGGIIKTTRIFCREHNGKTYSRDEIALFDPKVAIPPGYNPFTDLGGYGCRHHLNWIPQSVAFALRPDLKNNAN
jgi:hypothetical protein